MKLSDETLKLYQDRIARGRWMSWEKYSKLKIGDTFVRPYCYRDTDQVIGETTTTVKRLWVERSNNSWDYGLEHGCLGGSTYTTFFDETKKPVFGSVVGTFAVNLDEVETPKDTFKKEIIDAALSYMSSRLSHSEYIKFKEYLESYE